MPAAPPWPTKTNPGALPSNVRLLLPFAFVYLGFALVNIRLKLLATTAWFNGNLEENHKQLLAFGYTNNEQSRVLQYYVPEFFHAVFGLTIPDAYVLQRLLFVFAAFCAFHLYLGRWFDARCAMLGVATLAAIMPWSYFNHLQESAPLLMLMFLLCLWAIRESRPCLYAALLLIGAMANETVLILPAVWWFYHLGAFNLKSPDWRKLWRVSATTLLTCAPAYLWTAFIRYVTRDAEHLGGAWHLPNNLAGIAQALLDNPLYIFDRAYAFIFLIFGAMWIYAYLRWREKPPFLRSALLVVPLFVAIHLVTGIIVEVRQMLPISFIIIPSMLWYLVPPDPAPTPPPALDSHSAHSTGKHRKRRK